MCLLSLKTEVGRGGFDSPASTNFIGLTPGTCLSRVHNGFVIRTNNDGMNQSFGHSDSTVIPRLS